MNMLHIFLVILVADKTSATVVSHSDPSACQRLIKFMLINACGATKRESHSLPKYNVMTEEEIEQRYHQMVQAKMIKGVEKNYIDKVDIDTNDIDDSDYSALYNSPYYRRIRRSVIGLRSPVKNYAEAIEHERRGSFHFIGNAPCDDDYEGSLQEPSPRD